MNLTATAIEKTVDSYFYVSWLASTKPIGGDAGSGNGTVVRLELNLNFIINAVCLIHNVGAWYLCVFNFMVASNAIWRENSVEETLQGG